MRLSNTTIPGFAGTVVLVICAAAIVGGSAFGPRPAGLRLVDASGAMSIGNDREGQAVLSAAGLVPGRAVSGRVTVAAGSAALTLGETAPVDTPGPGGGRLSGELSLRVQDVTDPAAPRAVYSGTLAALSQTALGAAASGGARTYEFTVAFPATPAGDLNAYMASATSVGFVWDATVAPGPAASYAEQVAYDGPLAYWDLGAGATVADRGGRHDGALANGVVGGADGVAGDHTAAWFDGASGYAYVNGLAAPRRAYTLEAWHEPDRSGDMTIVEQGGAGSLLLRDGHPVFRQTDTDVVAPSALAPGTWHHVAGTWDGHTARLYLDGALVASGTATTPPSGASTVYIGYGAHAPWFAGTIDGVAYFPTALSADRIAAHHSAVTVPAQRDAAASPVPATAPAVGDPAPAGPPPGTAATTPARVAVAGHSAKAKAKAKARARARARAKARAKAQRKHRIQRRRAHRHS